MSPTLPLGGKDFAPGQKPLIYTVNWLLTSEENRHHMLPWEDTTYKTVLACPSPLPGKTNLNVIELLYPTSNYGKYQGQKRSEIMLIQQVKVCGKAYK